MTREQFNNLLCEGFNAKMLADVFQTSEGHINELRRAPQYEKIVEAISTTFKLSVEEVKEVVASVNEKPNTDALYDFAVRKGIDLEAIDLKAIAEAKTIRNERPSVEVGTKTAFGEIVAIKKIGNAMVYLVNRGNGNIEALGTKEVLDNLITE